MNCTVTDCVRKSHAKGYCHSHYDAWKLHGDPLVRKRAPAGSGTIDKSGYRVMHNASHPIAAPNGRVFEHRMVLFDAIGPGPHLCHWNCGKLLDWVNIVVDHLDSDPSNNSLSNLVPACQPCNVIRPSLETVFRFYPQFKPVTPR